MNKVKVVGYHKKTYWYSDHVGHIFDLVRIEEDGSYIVLGTSVNPYHTHVIYHIRFEDGRLVFDNSFVLSPSKIKFKFI